MLVATAAKTISAGRLTKVEVPLKKRKPREVYNYTYGLIEPSSLSHRNVSLSHRNTARTNLRLYHLVTILFAQLREII